MAQFIYAILPALLAACTLCSHASADIEVLDQPMWVFPGQMFRIALRQPAGSGQLAVTYPDSVELFDQWDQDDRQRYYFRASAPGDAALVFEGQGGRLELTVHVIPWRNAQQPREWASIKLPRLWPLGEAEYSEVKSRHTLHTEDEIERMRQSGAAPGPLAVRWLGISDEEVFNVIPGPVVPRTCLMTMSNEERGKGCPVCGTAIYEGRSGFYPWLFDAEKHPWKVGCPNCGNWFPSNDWQNGDMHSGSFPDDGWGCEPAEPVPAPSGKPFRYPFIAYYHEWQAYMSTFTPAITQCANAYISTGDKRYAHKCAIALFRFAESFVDMSLNLNHRKLANRDGITRGPVGAPLQKTMKRVSHSFTYIQPNWDTPRMESCARAWDLVFDAIDGDEELLRFCREHHHPQIRSADDFRRFIEAGVHRMPAQAAMDNAVSRNWPQQESMLATMALGMGTPRSLQIVDWLLNEGAGLRYSLTNEYFKDGAGHESEGYNGLQIRYMNRLVMLLDRIAKLHPEQFKEPRFISMAKDPKFKQIYLFPLWNSLIGRTYPSTGDTGKAGKPNPLPAREGYPLAEGDFADIYGLTRDPRFAQAMYGPDGQVPSSLADPGLRAQAEAIGQERGWQIEQTSDILDGFGHVILRSGEGDDQRALWMRYGRVVQHSHPDMLSIGLEGMTRKLLPELGYPQGWTYAGAWESNWGTHYVTHIGGARTYGFGRGQVTLFADSAPARIATADSTYLTGEAPRHRREKTIVLVDVDQTRFYAVILERVFGGGKHYWSFHGPDGEASAQGIALESQGGGTMLGPDAAYRDDSSVAKVDRDLSCFAFMTDVQRGVAPETWSLDYLLRDQDDVHLRMTSVSPMGAQVATAKGRAPGGKSGYEITWAIQQIEGGAPLSSQFLTVLEPYEGDRFITGIEPVAVSGGDSGLAAPLAVRITGEGFTDTLVLQPAGGTQCETADGLQCDGEFALWRQKDGRPTTAVLAAGTRLAMEGAGLQLAASEYTGTIRECDWESRKIRVSFTGPDGEPAISQTAQVSGFVGENQYARQDVQFVGLSPEQAAALVGQHVWIGNDLGSHASYIIREARWVGPLLEITLGLDPRVGEGTVRSCKDGVVISGTGMRLASYAYYAGKTLANETGTAMHKLRDVVKGSQCVLAEGVPAAELEAQFADQDGDGLPRLLIYDYGPGDTVKIKNWVSARLRQ